MPSSSAVDARAKRFDVLGDFGDHVLEDLAA